MLRCASGLITLHTLSQVEVGNQKFFGPERKRQARWMTDLVKSLETDRDACEQGNEEREALEKHRKTVGAIVEICAAQGKFALESADFASRYEQALQFLTGGEVRVEDGLESTSSCLRQGHAG